VNKAHPIEVWGIPTCGTTKKALRFLETKQLPHVFRNYRDVRPTKALLVAAMNSLPDPRRMFNTSGGSYRDGGFKDKAASMTPAQIIDALLADPMLIKRPIVKTPNGIAVGYDEPAIDAIL
jgi:arsenate reductase (glutaredoxin)